MTSLRTKLLLAVTAAGATAAALLPLYRARTADKLIDLRLSGDGELALATGDVRPPANPTDRAGVSVLDAEHPIFPASSFVRVPAGPERFRRDTKNHVADPHAHFRRQGNLDRRRSWPEHPDGEWTLRTNSIGLREDVEVLDEQPGLRILVAGDSHTDGVCNNAEAFGNLLELRLQGERPADVVESLNAGCGGYHFYNYLGTLERFLVLEPDVFVVAVYGGNDFEETLTPFHNFNGTQRPPGVALYADQISRVMKIEDLQPCLAQAFMSYKYFDVHPEQMEVALQVARDVTTEILATCLRHSVHPVFVYIPSMPDSEWDSDPDLFNRLTEMLEVSPEGLASTDRMADSFIAFLRDRRVDVIDMRGVFERAGPGNFWIADQHMSVRAQALIAQELHPFVVAARPPGAERARRAPVSTGPAHPGDLLSPGSHVEEVSDSGAVVESTFARPGPEGFDAARGPEFFGERPHTVHDARAGYRYEADLELSSRILGFEERFPFITNDQGFLADLDVAGEVDLRIVLAGDEQLVGNFVNGRNLAHLVEVGLQERHPGSRVEALNAAVAGHSFLNYLGVLERSLELDPQVFVVAFSSGSDFAEALRLDCLLEDRKFARNFEGQEAVLQRARRLQPGAMVNSFESIKYFCEHSRTSHRAYKIAMGATREMQRLCAERGIELVVLEIPDPLSFEWSRHAEELEPLRALLRIAPRLLDTNQRMAEAYLRDLEEGGVTVLRLGDVFRPKRPGLYSPAGLLLTPAAHCLMAPGLVEHLDALGLLD